MLFDRTDAAEELTFRGLLLNWRPLLLIIAWKPLKYENTLEMDTIL